MKIILKAFLRGQLISEYESVLRPNYIYITRPLTKGDKHQATWDILKDLEFKAEIKGDP